MAGGTAAIPPISRTLTFGRVGEREGPPVIDLGAGRSDGWREGRGDGGLGRGIYKEYSHFNNVRGGGKNYSLVGLGG